MDADADEEGESREGGNLGEDKELIGRGGDDAVDEAGGSCVGGSKGRGGVPSKAPAEERGGTQEGRGEG